MEKETQNFEEAMTRLEEILKKLEDTNLPLEESSALYEEGIKLKDYCAKLLEKERKNIVDIAKEYGISEEELNLKDIPDMESFGEENFKEDSEEEDK